MGNCCCCSNPLPGRDPLDPDFSSSRPKAVWRLNGKAEPSMPPQPPLLAPRGSPLGEEHANPLVLARCSALGRAGPYATGYAVLEQRLLTRGACLEAALDKSGSAGLSARLTLQSPAAGHSRR